MIIVEDAIRKPYSKEKVIPDAIAAGPAIIGEARGTTDISDNFVLAFVLNNYFTNNML